MWPLKYTQNGCKIVFKNQNTKLLYLEVVVDPEGVEVEDPDAVVVEGSEGVGVVHDVGEDAVVVAGAWVVVVLVESSPPTQTSTPLKSIEVTTGTDDPELEINFDKMQHI